MTESPPSSSLPGSLPDPLPDNEQPATTDGAGERRGWRRFFGRGDSPDMPAPQPDDRATATGASVAGAGATEIQAPGPAAAATVAPASPAVADTPASTETTAPVASSFLQRMKTGLSRTRDSLGSGLANLFIGRKEIDDELLEELETQMLVADMGVEATRRIINTLTDKVSRKELLYSDALYQALQDELTTLLEPAVAPLAIDSSKQPYVILVVGVNGVGKTTTIGKLAKRLQTEGKSVMLAAGDTFRAAAVEQLQVWGERNNIPVIAQHTGADSASVIFDAAAAARSRGADVLIADTAGRLHNKTYLMDELRKVVRVLQKQIPDGPHEVMLVVDAGTGQNALNQAHDFHDAVPLTGITITKLDGTAKGGMVFNIASRLQIPIRFIGVGEQIDDLRPLVARDFVEALFDADSFAVDKAGLDNGAKT